MKNPSAATIDELVTRILDGPPGSELDQSLLKNDDQVSVMLTGGKNLMEMPNDFSRKQLEDFSLKEWLIDDAKGIDEPCDDCDRKEK